MSTTSNTNQTSNNSGRPHHVRILTAIDKSDAARWALEVGTEMARKYGAELMLVNVVVPAYAVAGEYVMAMEQLDTQHHQEGEELLEKLRKALPPSIQSQQKVSEGVPADEIVNAAREWEADFIVLGTRARSAVARFLLGSTAEAVIRRAPCPVVTVGHKLERLSHDGGKGKKVLAA